MDPIFLFLFSHFFFFFFSLNNCVDGTRCYVFCNRVYYSILSIALMNRRMSIEWKRADKFRLSFLSLGLFLCSFWFSFLDNNIFGTAHLLCVFCSLCFFLFFFLCAFSITSAVISYKTENIAASQTENVSSSWRYLCVWFKNRILMRIRWWESFLLW